MFILRYLRWADFDCGQGWHQNNDFFGTLEELKEALEKLREEIAHNDAFRDHRNEPRRDEIEDIQILSARALGADEFKNIWVSTDDAYHAEMEKARAGYHAEDARYLEQQRREYERLKAKFGAEGSSTDDHMIKLFQD